MASTTDRWLSSRAIARASLVLLLAGPAFGQVTTQVSLPGSGFDVPGDAFDPTLSADGRYVAFFWYESLFHCDVYLKDRETGALERLSVDSNGAQGDSYSYAPSLTPDLRTVAFSSFATNLVAGDTNGPYPAGHDVFVRDRASGTTERVSVATGGAQGLGSSTQPSISADTRYVAFSSLAENLVGTDSNRVQDVFVRDRTSGTTERVSVASSGQQADGASSTPSISADGRYVAFQSSATDLVPDDENGRTDVFVRDRVAGTTERVSVSSSGAEGTGDSDVPVLSADGRYVAFRSTAEDLVDGDTNRASDVFLHDRQTGTTERVSVSSSEAQGLGDSAAPALTPDGRFVAFKSAAENLVPADDNGRVDVFVRDRLRGRTVRVSVATDGDQGTADSGIQAPSITDDGRVVAFDSRATLAATDTDSSHDIYVRVRRYAALDALCAPGLDGVVGCPCMNPPAGPERGCDNAAGTGGAALSASGVAELASDSLVLRTDGQGASSISVVLQGDAALGAGAVFGHGVSCVDGTLTRLDARRASAGGIVVPGPGEASISARSAALGDPIQPGESRWYLVLYRDPPGLGGCTSGGGFNATTTGRVLWLP